MKLPKEIAIYVKNVWIHQESDSSHTVVFSSGNKKFLLEKGCPAPKVDTVVVLTPSPDLSGLRWYCAPSDTSVKLYSLDGTRETFALWRVVTDE